MCDGMIPHRVSTPVFSESRLQITAPLKNWSLAVYARVCDRGQLLDALRE